MIFVSRGPGLRRLAASRARDTGGEIPHPALYLLGRATGAEQAAHQATPPSATPLDLSLPAILIQRASLGSRSATAVLPLPILLLASRSCGQGGTRSSGRKVSASFVCVELLSRGGQPWPLVLAAANARSPCGFIPNSLQRERVRFDALHKAVTGKAFIAGEERRRRTASSESVSPSRQAWPSQCALHLATAVTPSGERAHSWGPSTPRSRYSGRSPSRSHLRERTTRPWSNWD
jgi:hypothetical protein